MSQPLPALDENAERIFAAVRTHKAMPLFEIAATTGIRGDLLTGTVKVLQNHQLVTVKGTKPTEMIVSVSGSYY